MMNCTDKKNSAPTLKQRLMPSLISLLLMQTLCAGCAATSSVSKSSLSVYQPEYLTLKKGQKIELADGSTYITQRDGERWWSDKAFRLKIEDEIAKGYK